MLSMKNAKAAKGLQYGLLNGILYLAPANMAGHDVCPYASQACKRLCLGHSAGRVCILPNIMRSRIAKTKRLFSDRAGFLADLGKAIAKLERKAARFGLIPCVRLNGSSDLAWELIPYEGFSSIMAAFPSVRFYDYCKSPFRMARFLAGEMPPNYHLTFSFSGENEPECREVLAQGGSVAVPLLINKGEAKPATCFGHAVVDGDSHDFRPLDGGGVVVGLTAKGKAARRGDNPMVLNRNDSRLTWQ